MWHLGEIGWCMYVCMCVSVCVRVCVCVCASIKKSDRECVCLHLKGTFSYICVCLKTRIKIFAYSVCLMCALCVYMCVCVCVCVCVWPRARINMHYCTRRPLWYLSVIPCCQYLDTISQIPRPTCPTPHGVSTVWPLDHGMISSEIVVKLSDPLTSTTQWTDSNPRPPLKVPRPIQHYQLQRVWICSMLANVGS